MPVSPVGQPAAAGAARSRGMRRLSAVTAGVGVAGVLAAGAIAFTLPGATHTVTGGTATSSGGSGSPAPHATSGSSSVATSPASAPGSAKSSVSSSSGGSSSRADATSGES
jgi:hypothetical protein